MKYLFHVNNEHDLELDEKAWKEMDIQALGEGRFHILKNNQSFHGEVIETDFLNRTLTLLINGNTYQVKISDAYDQLVKRLGLSVSSRQIVKDVKAPMPGLVLEVLVEEGKGVLKGDGLLILEAMKMENIIKAQGDGEVKAVHIKKGQAVDKGDILLEMK